jgi:hypothetical protein
MGAVYIIEGVPGSGKDTLAGQLMHFLGPEERHVQMFTEEASLASWLHYFIPGIHELRLDLTARLIEHVAESLEREPEMTFIFNRFHVSHAIWRRELNAEPALEERHAVLVKALSNLPVLILQTVIDGPDADLRSSHVERRDLAWARFLAQRLQLRGPAVPGARYLEQQQAISEIIERDGLPHRRLEVRYGEPIDLASLLA